MNHELMYKIISRQPISIKKELLNAGSCHCILNYDDNKRIQDEMNMYTLRRAAFNRAAFFNLLDKMTKEYNRIHIRNNKIAVDNITIKDYNRLATLTYMDIYGETGTLIDKSNNIIRNPSLSRGKMLFGTWERVFQL
jgi:hypothetical protein